MKKVFLVFLFAVAAFAQVSPFRTPRATFTDPNGVPLAGGCIFTYQGGTTTPLATYTDYTGSTPNSNPVILDSTGSAVMWLGANTYKFVAFSQGGTNCATGVQQWSEDQVPGDVWLGGTISGANITNSTITNSTIDSSVIGGTTPAPVNASYFNGPIGTNGGTPAPGAFSRLSGLVNNMTFSSAPVFDAGSYSGFIMTLAGNVASSTVSGGVTGQWIQFELCQNTTGGYTFVWPSNFTNAPPMPATPSACITPYFWYDGAAWQFVNYLAPTSSSSFDNVTWSATPTFPVDPYFLFALTLTGDVTSSTITGSITGQIIGFQLCQNSVGGFAFVWPTSFLNPPNVPAAANVCITPRFMYNGANWVVLNQNIPVSPQTVAFTATPAFNANAYNQFGMTLTSDVTSSTLSGGYFGEAIAFNICQDGTGGRAFAWPGNLLNAPAISSTASSCTASVAVNGGADWYVVSSNSTGGFTSGSNSNGSWVKDPTGHIHQWGSVACPGTNPCTATFPIAFAGTTGLIIQVSAYYPGADTGYFTVDSNTPPTTTSFDVHQNNLTGMTLYWTADGN